MKSIIKNIENNTKLQKRLLVSYLLVIILSLPVYFIIADKRITHYIQEQTVFSARQTFDQTHSFLSYTLLNVRKVSTITVMDSTINSIMAGNSDNQDIYSQLTEFEYIKSFLYPLEDNYEVMRIRLYIKGDVIYTKENKNLFPYEQITDTIWYKRLNDENLQFLLCPSWYMNQEEDTNQYLSMARLVRNLNDYRQYIGAVTIDIPATDIIEILAKNIITPDSICYIQNSRGEILAQTPQQLPKELLSQSVIYNVDASENDHDIITLNSRKVLVLSRILPDTDCHVVSVVPIENIGGMNSQHRNSMLVMLALIVVLSYFLAYYISLSVTKRISRLNENMKRVQKGDLALLEHVDSQDEISELIGSYNYMIKRIKCLMQEQFDNGKRLKSAELRILQAQINPHFLYNTLDLIRWLSLKNMSPSVIKVVDSLADFYKIGLSKGNEIISIKQELRHVLSYVTIQNLRYMDKYELIIDVDEEIQNHNILKLTLQPIVENAILHGIQPKPEKKGIIKITGRFEEKDVIILTVLDDGVGIDKEGLDNLLTDGFGVRNVDNRIKLYFGNQYGLIYDSIPSEFTKVDIRIPTDKFDSTTNDTVE